MSTELRGRCSCEAEQRRGGHHAIQAEKHCRPPDRDRQLAGRDAGRGRSRHRTIGKDGWQPAQGVGLARQFGDNDP